ncbi:MAG: phytanoyl-CoA dioxygenase family protein [Ilumatobacteraceae bacterium]
MGSDGDRREPGLAVAAGQAGQRRGRRRLRRGLLQLAAAARHGTVHRESPGAEIAAELTGSETIRLYHDHVLVKEPGTRQRTPWHQDLPYYNVDGAQNASMWFPVDPVERSATLEFIAGSHRGPWYLPRTFLDDEARWFPDGSLAELPDFEAEPDRWTVLGWELQPGDAVFFNMLTVHGSGGVSGGSRRRVLSVRFLGDDMVHAPRPWTTSPPFDGLEAEIPAGAPMDHPRFPVVWQRHAGGGGGPTASPC